ncbi:MAG: TM1812 family CRISPR-associated protein [Candidatus Freyarchaeota archaeon]
MTELKSNLALVGVLGAGNWAKVYYQMDEDSLFTNYATYAIKSILEKRGVRFDEVLLFGTHGSNWNIANDLIKKYRSIIVPEGKDESELKETYMTFFRELSPYKSIVLDLTHAFRHLSQLLLIAAYYLDLLGETKVEGIYYALLPEPREGAHSTIVNLKPLLTSLKALFNVETFRETLKVSRLDLILEDLTSYAKQTYNSQERKLFSEIGSVLKALKTLGLYVSVNYTPKIVDQSRNISEMAKQLIETVEQNYPYILPSLNILISEADELASFGNHPLWHAQLQLAEKCLKLGKYTSAIINLREGFLTYTCHKLSNCQEKNLCEKHSKCESRKTREEISKQLFETRNNKNQPQPLREYAKTFDKIAQLRNNIVHGYMGRKNALKHSLEKEIKELLAETNKLITKYQNSTNNSIHKTQTPNNNQKQL